MSNLQLLRDLQGTLDNLRTIERDLAALPPDLALLDQKLKAVRKEKADKTKQLEVLRLKRETHAKDLATADKSIADIRSHLKEATQKVQYAALIREQEEHERSHNAAIRPLKEADAQIQQLEADLADLTTREAAQAAEFAVLHEAFLGDHANQVEARTLLEAKRTELEGALAPADLARFKKILEARQGRAVVAVENGLCGGCRTRLRPVVASQLREGKLLLTCESCHRFLYLA
ncbi:MAG TPA: C4-type zinc ribbon domain-containing protein [Holophagaceae bacterium]|nr:C4-type zinc ribbon domain-containing protein [Holophagaceae bacterium]